MLPYIDMSYVYYIPLSYVDVIIHPYSTLYNRLPNQW